MDTGETFILYKQAKQQKKGGHGTKRELIQLGAPIFGQITEGATNQCLKGKYYIIVETHLVCFL